MRMTQSFAQKALFRVAIALAISAAGACLAAPAWSANATSPPPPNPCLAKPRPLYCEGTYHPGLPAPSTVHVTPKGPTIQAALSRVRWRGKVILSKGTYKLSKPLEVHIPVTIMAADKAEGLVTLRFTGGNCMFIDNKKRALKVTLQGLTIESAAPGTSACITSDNAELRLVRDVINIAGASSAIALKSGELYLGIPETSPATKRLKTKSIGTNEPARVRIIGPAAEPRGNGIESAYNTHVFTLNTELSRFATALKLKGSAELGSGTYVQNNTTGLEVEEAPANPDVFAIKHPEIKIDGASFLNNTTGVKVDPGFVVKGITITGATFTLARGEGQAYGIQILQPYVHFPIDHPPGNITIESTMIAGPGGNEGHRTGIAIESAAPLKVSGGTISDVATGVSLNAQGSTSNPDRELYTISSVQFDRSDVGLDVTKPVEGTLAVTGNTSWSDTETPIKLSDSSSFSACQIDSPAICSLPWSTKRKLKKACHLESFSCD